MNILERIKYETCQSSMDLMTATMQNAMIDFLSEERIVDIMEKFGYLNREPMINALKQGARRKKVTRAMNEMTRYLMDHEHEELSNFLILLCMEWYLAVREKGRKIHFLELDCYGRDFKK